VPEDAFTAAILGTERIGSGVVINDSGLVLTIGYLITEADSIWLTAHDGRAVPGDTLAYDHATGFGLVQPLGRLGLPHLKLAEPHEGRIGDEAIAAAGGGRMRARRTSVIAREEFAGYWEYLLDEALFTAPAHPLWSGAALISGTGTLLGIGSLILQRDSGRNKLDLNMFVPSWHLRPILSDLTRFGRVDKPARPWIGITAVESADAIFIGGISESGPADEAGIQPGDRIIAVGETEIEDLPGLWRSIWQQGPAGAPIPLTLARKSRTYSVTVTSADRTTRFTTPKLH
jgi:S1-C subfamily serine protease